MDNALDRSFGFSYDPNDRLTQEQIVNSLVPNSPVASTTRYEYGTLGTGGSLSAGTTLARVTKFQGTNTSATGTKLQQTEYRYDVAGQTAEVKIESFGSSPSVTTTSFTYDHAGTRLSKSESDGLTSKTTLYTVDAANPTGYAQVIEELTTTSGSSGTQVRTSYVIGLDVIAQQSAERTLAAGTWSAWQQQEMLTLLYDGHGSTRALLIGVGSGSPNSSPPIPPAQIATGQLFTYDAYGQMLPRFAGTSEVAINPKTTLLYSGEQTDRSTGLQYLRARYYSAASGRFTQMDPFAGMQTDPQSLHKYLYAHANPVMNADPSGEIIPLLLGALQLGIAGGIAGGAFGAAFSFADSYLGNGDFNDAIDAAFWGGLSGAAVGAVSGGVGGAFRVAYQGFSLATKLRLIQFATDSRVHAIAGGLNFFGTVAGVLTADSEEQALFRGAFGLLGTVGSLTALRFVKSRELQRVMELAPDSDIGGFPRIPQAIGGSRLEKYLGESLSVSKKHAGADFVTASGKRIQLKGPFLNPDTLDSAPIGDISSLATSINNKFKYNSGFDLFVIDTLGLTDAQAMELSDLLVKSTKIIVLR